MEDDLSKGSKDTGMESEAGGGAAARSKLTPVLAALCVILLAGLVVLAVLLGVRARGGVTKDYERKWRRIMVEFENKVEKDDKKAEEYSKNKDITALLRLARTRTNYFGEVVGRLLELTPPKEYRKLHVLTLHYIFTLIDQLKAQRELNEAFLEGKPTEDLSKIAENAKARAQQGMVELSVEIQKAGITLEVVEKKSRKSGK